MSADGAFLLKFLFIIVGVVLTVYLYGTMKREAASWETAGAVSSDGVKFVAPTLLAWCVVLIFSRLTAMLGSDLESMTPQLQAPERHSIFE